MDLKLEVIVLPVSDVDRARSFYEAAGFRMDADRAAHDDYRVVQFTPPSWIRHHLRRGGRRETGCGPGPVPHHPGTSRKPSRSSAAGASR